MCVCVCVTGGQNSGLEGPDFAAVIKVRDCVGHGRECDWKNEVLLCAVFFRRSSVVNLRRIKVSIIYVLTIARYN